MAALSEEDRKTILGKDWKPFVETPKEKRGRARVIVAFLAVATLGGLFFAFSSGTKNSVASKALPITKASAPLVGTSGVK